MSLVKGIQFASRIHKNDVRKHNGEPYINHCLRVMHRTILHPVTGGNEKYATVSVCHDTYEDHPDCEQELAEIFGAEIFIDVAHLTNVFTPKAYPKLNRAARKKNETYRLSVCSDPIKVIKLIDRLDNLESYLEDCREYYKQQYPQGEDPTGFGVRYAFESVELLHAIGDPAPVLRDEGLSICYRLIELYLDEDGYLTPGEQGTFEELQARFK